MYATLYSLDPRLVWSIIKYESNFNSQAISSKGAVGLMQLMPQSVHLSKKSLYDPRINIREGTRYLALMRDECPHKADMEWIICYELGAPHAKKVKHPKQWKYYREVKRIYEHEAPSL